MFSFNVVCDSGRTYLYRLLRIEGEIFKATGDALRTWTSQNVDQEANLLYYSTLGALATANNASLQRMNQLRLMLGLQIVVDNQVYPVHEPPDLTP